MSEADTDIDPRHEAFWFLGGIEPPGRILKIRKNDWQKEYANDPVDRNFQYVGKPLLTLRHEHPLESQLEFEHFSAEDVAKVPDYRMDPTTAGYVHDYRSAVTVPGKTNSIRFASTQTKNLNIFFSQDSGPAVSKNSDFFRTKVVTIFHLEMLSMARKIVKKRFTLKQLFPVTLGYWARHAIKDSLRITIQRTHCQHKQLSPMVNYGHSTSIN